MGCTSVHPFLLLMAHESLHESECLIERTRALESAERWAGISRKTYRQIADAWEALRRLEEALAALNKRLHGGKAVSSAPGLH